MKKSLTKTNWVGYAQLLCLAIFTLTFCIGMVQTSKANSKDIYPSINILRAEVKDLKAEISSFKNHVHERHEDDKVVYVE